MRDLACKYVLEVYNEIIGQRNGVYCTVDPTPYASFYRVSVSGCAYGCILPKVPSFPTCDINELNCTFTLTDTTTGLVCSTMFLTMGGDIIIPTPPQATILGPFVSDAAAQAAGVLIGQEYYLAINNIYGYPSDGGMRKTRLA